MKLSVRVEVEVPFEPGDERAAEWAAVAARALEERGATILHAASVRRRV